MALRPHDVSTATSEQLERAYDSIIDGTDSGALAETTMRCKDGSLIPVEARREVMRSEGATLIVGVMRDVSARKASEAAARRAQARLLESETRFSPDGRKHSRRLFPARHAGRPIPLCEPSLPGRRRTQLREPLCRSRLLDGAIHPDDRARVAETFAREIAVARSSTSAGSCGPTARCAGSTCADFSFADEHGATDARGRSREGRHRAARAQVRLKRMNRVYAVLSQIIR
jgi:hypothetical protein